MDNIFYGGIKLLDEDIIETLNWSQLDKEDFINKTNLITKSKKGKPFYDVFYGTIPDIEPSTNTIPEIREFLPKKYMADEITINTKRGIRNKYIPLYSEDTPKLGKLLYLSYFYYGYQPMRSYSFTNEAIAEFGHYYLKKRLPQKDVKIDVTNFTNPFGLITELTKYNQDYTIKRKMPFWLTDDIKIPVDQYAKFNKEYQESFLQAMPSKSTKYYPFDKYLISFDKLSPKDLIAIQEYYTRKYDGDKYTYLYRTLSYLDAGEYFINYKLGLKENLEYLNLMKRRHKDYSHINNELRFEYLLFKTKNIKPIIVTSQKKGLLDINDLVENPLIQRADRAVKFAQGLKFVNTEEYNIIDELIQDMTYKYRMISNFGFNVIETNIVKIESIARTFKEKLITFKKGEKLSSNEVYKLTYSIALSVIFDYLIFETVEQKNKSILFNFNNAAVQNCFSTNSEKDTKTLLIEMGMCLIKQFFSKTYTYFKDIIGGKWKSLFVQLYSYIKSFEKIKTFSIMDIYKAVDKRINESLAGEIIDDTPPTASEIDNYYVQKIFIPGGVYKKKTLVAHLYKDPLFYSLSSYYKNYSVGDYNYSPFHYCVTKAHKGKAHVWSNKKCENCGIGLHEAYSMAKKMKPEELESIKNMVKKYDSYNIFKQYCTDFFKHDIQNGYCLNCGESKDTIDNPTQEYLKRAEKAYNLFINSSRYVAVNNLEKATPLEFPPKEAILPKKEDLDRGYEDIQKQVNNMKKIPGSPVTPNPEKLKEITQIGNLEKHKKESLDFYSSFFSPEYITKLFDGLKYDILMDLLRNFVTNYNIIKYSENNLSESKKSGYPNFVKRFMAHHKEFKYDTSELNDFVYTTTFNTELSYKEKWSLVISQIYNLVIVRLESPVEKFMFYEYYLRYLHLDRGLNMTYQEYEDMGTEYTELHKLRKSIEMGLSEEDKKNIGFEYMTESERNKYLDELIAKKREHVLNDPDDEGPDDDIPFAGEDSTDFADNITDEIGTGTKV